MQIRGGNMICGFAISIIKDEQGKTIGARIALDNGYEKKYSTSQLKKLQSNKQIRLFNAIVDSRGYVRKKSNEVNNLAIEVYKTKDTKHNNEIVLLQKIFTRTSQGAISKGWYLINKQVYLVKSNYPKEYNPFAEVIGSRIANNISKGYSILYSLDSADKYPEIKGDLPLVSLCKKWEHFSTVKFYNYVDSKNGNEVKNYFQWLINNGTREQIYFTSLMLFIDAIIGNKDRHLGNWEIDMATHNVTKFIDFGNSCLSEHKDRIKYKGGIEPDVAKPFSETHFNQVKKVKLLLKRYNLKLKVPSIEKAILINENDKDIQLIKKYDRQYYENVKKYIQNRAVEYYKQYMDCLEVGV